MEILESTNKNLDQEVLVNIVQPQKKSVRFELPTEQTGLDLNLRERLQHNMLYKDDTIF